ncbi:transcriptional regulator [Salipiger sp. IMCC34102]|uniref:winged helix-turn-helix transcriptional regulator n=1 Tax=Salipiger sp. IMCC34102 TaxID=2510647 RepID=UPI00101D0BBC|nr:helix-turn-helix domain-containing protein [Salipiger sp. IMCC34102]RYH04501.1 transcriptional regulator [Salipiger sp. IMCC34102]
MEKGAKPGGRIDEPPAFSRGDLLSPKCPSRQILTHMTSRWGGLTLFALGPEPQRFGALRRRIGGISERMLSQTLKQLTADGLVARISHETVPPHVRYRLTPLGEEAAGKLGVLADWIEESLPRLLQGRTATD